VNTLHLTTQQIHNLLNLIARAESSLTEQDAELQEAADDLYREITRQALDQHRRDAK
jgi:hypothetical protein